MAIVTLDHEAQLSPAAIAIHVDVGADLSVDLTLNCLQDFRQERPVIVSCRHGNGQILFLLAFHVNLAKELCAEEIDIASLKKSKIYGLPCDVVDNKDGTGTFTVYVIAQGINADKTKYKAIEVTEELLSQANANNVNKISSQKPEAVGAASIVKNGKTYVGVAPTLFFRSVLCSKSTISAMQERIPMPRR